MNRIILSLVLLLVVVTSSCRSQEPPQPTINQAPAPALALFTNEVIDENTLSSQIQQRLADLRRDTATIDVTVRRIALINAAQVLTISSIIANIEPSRTYTIKKESVTNTMFNQKRRLRWTGITRSANTSVILSLNLYLEESPTTTGGYIFRYCKLDDYNAPGRYYYLEPLTTTQDLWYISALDPSKLNYRIDD